MSIAIGTQSIWRFIITNENGTEVKMITGMGVWDGEWEKVVIQPPIRLEMGNVLHINVERETGIPKE